ncbi:JDVT-CTERM system glutamic-type intramembrane protease [Pseudomonadota bacterium]
MNNLQADITHVLRESGLVRCSAFYRDAHFYLAVIAGVVVLWFIHDLMPVFKSESALQWPLLLSILLWQPFVEELLFRGLIQGQLSRYKYAQQLIFKLTVANIATSVLFVATHVIGTPAIWSLTVFFPSLLFGYFRDKYNSVYPSMILHSAYNSMVVIGLLLYQ